MHDLIYREPTLEQLQPMPGGRVGDFRGSRCSAIQGMRHFAARRQATLGSRIAYLLRSRLVAIQGARHSAARQATLLLQAQRLDQLIQEHRNPVLEFRVRLFGCAPADHLTPALLDQGCVMGDEKVA